MASFQHLDVYAKERELEPIINLDTDSGVGQRQSLKHLQNKVRNLHRRIGITRQSIGRCSS